jgi:hypothetical protein
MTGRQPGPVHTLISPNQCFSFLLTIPAKIGKKIGNILGILEAYFTLNASSSSA